jgi:uncharacterized protein YqeY
VDLKARIGEDQKAALRAGDRLRVSVLRLLSALIKNREVEKRGPLTDPEVLQAIGTSCKQRLESIEQYRRGGRPDLADKEAAELAILESYLPSPLTSEELQAMVREAIQEIQATSIKEMGRVMALLMPRVTGRADGKVVNTLVRQALSQH